MSEGQGQIGAVGLEGGGEQGRRKQGTALTRHDT